MTHPHHLTTNNTNADAEVEVEAEVDNDDRDEYLRLRSSPTTTREREEPTVIEQLFERLNSLSSQLESAVELSSSLQAQHAAAQGTISALESKVTVLESLVASSPQSGPSPIESTSTSPASPDPATIPAILPRTPTRLHNANANRVEESRRRPIDLRARGVGFGAGATRFCAVGAGVEGARCGE
jgi:hypothetical protein